jgi:hypothetical protein
VSRRNNPEHAAFPKASGAAAGSRGPAADQSLTHPNNACRSASIADDARRAMLHEASRNL